VREQVYACTVLSLSCRWIILLSKEPASGGMDEDIWEAIDSGIEGPAITLLAVFELSWNRASFCCASRSLILKNAGPRAISTSQLTKLLPLSGHFSLSIAYQLLATLDLLLEARLPMAENRLRHWSATDISLAQSFLWLPVSWSMSSKNICIAETTSHSSFESFSLVVLQHAVRSAPYTWQSQKHSDRVVTPS